MKNLLLTALFYLTVLSLSVAGQDNSSTDKGPAGKEIIADLGRIVSPNGVQENYKVPLGDINQWIYVRGQNRANPIILFVHGGQASPMSPISWTWQRPLEEYFTIVNYDQRAAGRSFLEADPETVGKTLKIDRYVDDAIELAEHLKRKYKKRKVILVGHSWGTIISVNAAIKRPDLFYAYVGYRTGRQYG